LFDSGSHPDFLIVQRNGQFIRIGQIQDLIAQLSLKPVYASKRVVLIKEAERMNLESANSFLKILEEPPLNTLIVLAAADENLLLETILSRCQKISFSPLGRDVLRRIIKERHTLNEDDVEFVLNYSGGRIRKEFIANATELNVMRRQVLSLLSSLSLEKMVDHTTQLEQWVKKDLHEYFLEFCAIWLKDFYYLKVGAADQITNSDLINEIAATTNSTTPEQLIWAFDLTIETELAVKANAGRQLALESLIIQLKQVFEGIVVIYF
jgi:DNA polymerase-3 subunit delta'